MTAASLSITVQAVIVVLCCSAFVALLAYIVHRAVQRDSAVARSDLYDSVRVFCGKDGPSYTLTREAMEVEQRLLDDLSQRVSEFYSQLASLRARPDWLPTIVARDAELGIQVACRDYLASCAPQGAVAPAADLP